MICSLSVRERTSPALPDSGLMGFMRGRIPAGAGEAPNGGALGQMLREFVRDSVLREFLILPWTEQLFLFTILTN